MTATQTQAMFEAGGGAGVRLWAADLAGGADGLFAIGHEFGLTNLTPGAAIAAHERAKCAARIALRIVLARHAGLDAARRPFVLSMAGKPSLAASTGEERVHFSLAHCAAAALIGVSRAGPVGVDVEAPRSLRLSDHRRAQLLEAGRMLAPDDALPDAPEAAFLQAWVRLEALAKATGEGLGALLGRLSDPHEVARTEIEGVKVRVCDARLGRAGLHGAVAVATTTPLPSRGGMAAWLPLTRSGLEEWLGGGNAAGPVAPVTDHA